jgi:hypothetical protein
MKQVIDNQIFNLQNKKIKPLKTKTERTNAADNIIQSISKNLQNLQ